MNGNFLGANTLSSSSGEKFGTKLETQDIFLDLLRNIFPDNVIDATISQTMTEYTEEEGKAVNESSKASVSTIFKKSLTVTEYTEEEEDKAVNESSNASVSTIFKKSLVQSRGINILGLITICAAVGAAANTSLPQDSAFLSFFRQGQQIVMKIMTWLTWTTPVGVASLIAKSIAGVSSLGSIFLSLGRLVLCVVIGLTFHQVVTLPLIYILLYKKNPFSFLVRCGKAFFVSFAATATSVALPHMLEACRQNHVSSKVSRFVIPMSVTLHADASALYIASAALFVAHTSGEESLSVGDYFVVGTLSSVLSMTIPGVPSASIVTVVVILTSINQPLHGIALLFTVEWLLDRLRSGVNATSHVMCAAYTDVICNGRTRPKEESEETDNEASTRPWTTSVPTEGGASSEPTPNNKGILEMEAMEGENYTQKSLESEDHYF
ncbi:amino acid transporter [Elysia marginata]|uniref:Amino acid transporter n=1 Tax=Elysia marginata TaxID=1093978 RepID=A0AAV4JY51_9GAST|nr:amino acid transporter [Elysia marginata]